MTGNLKPSLTDIQAAEKTIREVVRPTPLIRSEALSEAAGAEVFLKLENLLQPVGSFKLRGAFNKFASLGPEEKERGAVAVSAGNHAQAVSFCARHFGVDSVVFMPENTPDIKIENTRRWGARIILRGRDYDDSERISHEFERETGRTFIHPFNDPAIIAGQGTVALEILRELPDVSALVVPVGGGGLICGMAAAARELKPGVKIIGMQPEASAPFMHSMSAGRLVKSPICDSIADALTGEIISEEFFEMFRGLVDEVAALGEEAIEAAIWWMLDRHRMAVEGGGAAGIAALLQGKVRAGGTIAVVVTGCGISAARLEEIIRKYKS